MKERKLRIEDALAATRAAVEEGIVPGGGTALINASKAVAKLVPEVSGDAKTGVQIVLRALEEPVRQIAAHAGVEGSIVWYHNLIAQILGSMGLVGVVGYGWLFYDRVRLLWRKRSRTTMAFALSYFAMLLISMTNPGMFCPMPNALLMVAMFVVVERQPDTAAVPVKVGSASTPERRLF